MRIDLNNLSSGETTPAVQSTTRASQSAANNKVENDAGAAPDQLSAAALSRTVTELPEVRQEKVAALAQQLRNGEYHVSAEQTADAILSQIRERQAA